MHRFLSIVACALALIIAIPAAANTGDFVKEGSIEVDLHFGGYFFLDAEETADFNDTFSYGAGVNFNFTSQFGAQFDFEMSPTEVNRRSMYQFHVNFIYHPITHDWFVPFLGAGPTFALNVPEGMDTDADPGANALIGVDLYPFEHIGFRAQARYVVRFATSDGENMAHDLLALFGMVVQFGGEEEVQIIDLDTDADGILDKNDVCPKVPGQASAKGCPDQDGDTLADDTDRCPKVAGPVELKGCADQDGDTIVDIDDRCPKEAGPKEHKGCPDVDGDKIANIDDRCPQIPGEAAYQGCPPPPPLEIVAKFSGRIDGIQFEYNKAIITKKSFEMLNAAAELLKKYPQVSVVVEGHTSAEGSAQYNITLSTDRAKAVVQYLIDQKINPDRLTWKGYGFEKPVVENAKSKRDKAKNRRIEFAPLCGGSPCVKKSSE
jgi:outer membrane protein OmpA-like peptidoglycan-associated protein